MRESKYTALDVQPNATPSAFTQSACVSGCKRVGSRALAGPLAQQTNKSFLHQSSLEYRGRCGWEAERRALKVFVSGEHSRDPGKSCDCSPQVPLRQYAVELIPVRVRIIAKKLQTLTQVQIYCTMQFSYHYQCCPYAPQKKHCHIRLPRHSYHRPFHATMGPPLRLSVLLLPSSLAWPFRRQHIPTSRTMYCPSRQTSIDTNNILVIFTVDIWFVKNVDIKFTVSPNIHYARNQTLNAEALLFLQLVINCGACAKIQKPKDERPAKKDNIVPLRIYTVAKYVCNQSVVRRSVLYLRDTNTAINDGKRCRCTIGQKHGQSVARSPAVRPAPFSVRALRGDRCSAWRRLESRVNMTR